MQPSILLAAGEFLGDCTIAELTALSSHGLEVSVNTFGWTAQALDLLKSSAAALPAVSQVSFDPASTAQFTSAFSDGGLGFDSLYWPPCYFELSAEFFAAACSTSLRRPLRVIAVPNSSLSHLDGVQEQIERHGIEVVNAPNMHPTAVAEFTIVQMGMIARRLSQFNVSPPVATEFRHREALGAGRSLQGRMLGVIGGSGKDGSAVARLALKVGMRVIAVGTGTVESNLRIKASGASPVSCLEELLRVADFVSVNSPHRIGSPPKIGAHEISIMKRGVGVVCCGAAENFDGESLKRDLSRPLSERHIDTLVLDMPFGGRRDPLAFQASDLNRELGEMGVILTPRIAGYTVDARVAACEFVAKELTRSLARSAESRKTVQASEHIISRSNSFVPNRFIEDAMAVARLAADEVVALRANGLHLQVKEDGSPVTNADLASEALMADAFRALGYDYAVSGEELEHRIGAGGDIELLLDGIDGTRNFRDGLYGWSISIAAVRGSECLAGVVYDPSCDVMYSAIRGGGAFMCFRGQRHDLTIRKTVSPDFSFSVGSFMTGGFRQVRSQIVEDCKALGGRNREWGCVSLSLCAVATGGFGAFMQGASKQHDHLAGVLILNEAGAITLVADIGQGRADVVACHPAIGDRILAIYRERVGILRSSESPDPLSVDIRDPVK